MFPFVCRRKLQDLESGATRGEIHTFLLEIVQSSTNVTNTNKKCTSQLQTYSEIRMCFWMLLFLFVSVFILLVLFKKNDDCLLDTIRTYDTVFRPSLPCCHKQTAFKVNDLL